MIKVNLNIGENIKALRKAKNMTQVQLAERVNITKATVSSYENSLRAPSYEVLIRIAQIFHVTTDNLLGFSNRYSLDISGLSLRQRNLVNEIVQLYNWQNEKYKELADSDSIISKAIALGIVNTFEIEEYKKSQGIE